MGRLIDWMTRFRPVGRPRGRAAICLRRPLSFERCESRLALSAATQATIAVERDALAGDVLLGRLWPGAAGSADGADASFTAVKLGQMADVAQSFNVASHLVQAAAKRGMEFEGGIISLDVRGADGLASRIAPQLSNWVVDAAFDVDSSGLTLPYGGLGAQVVGDARAAWNNSALSSRDHRAGWGFDPTGYSDLLGDSELTSSVDGVTMAAGSPLLRITAPLPPAASEGGTIDLTAMAGPTRWFEEPPSAAFAARAPAGPATAVGGSLSGGWRAPKSAVENLRARAVVYEVAFDRDDAAALPGGDGLDPLTRQTPGGAENDAPQTGDSAAAPVAQQQDRPRGVADAAVPNVAVTGAAAAGDAVANRAAPANESASRGAAARDAALAAWSRGAAPGNTGPDDGGPPADADGGLALAEARQHPLGLAVAAAVGAAPIVNRVRRARAQAAAEKAAGIL